MKRIKIIALSMLVAGISCKQPKNSSSAPPAATEPAKETQTGSQNTPSMSDSVQGTNDANRMDTGDSLSRFIVSFYSIGSGSEGEQMNNLKMFTTNFEKKIGKKVTWSETPWGREGEVDFCFSLKGLSTEEQTQFISGSKEVLSKAQWVHYLENKACRKPR